MTADSHLASAGFDASDAARVARLSTYRDMADYERAFDATPAVVHEALNDAVAFVDKARACLRVRGMLDEESTT